MSIVSVSVNAGSIISVSVIVSVTEISLTYTYLLHCRHCIAVVFNLLVGDALEWFSCATCTILS